MQSQEGRVPGNFDRVMKLEEELTTLRQTTLEELLKQRAEIEEKLELLGHAERKRQGESKRQAKTAKACRTCGQAGHNSRSCPEKKVHREEDAA